MTAAPTILLAVTLSEELVQWLEVRSAEEGVSVSRFLEFLLQEKRQREAETRRRAGRRAPAAPSPLLRVAPDATVEPSAD